MFQLVHTTNKSALLWYEREQKNIEINVYDALRLMAYETAPKGRRIDTIDGKRIYIDLWEYTIECRAMVYRGDWQELIEVLIHYLSNLPESTTAREHRMLSAIESVDTWEELIASWFPESNKEDIDTVLEEVDREFDAVFSDGKDKGWNAETLSYVPAIMDAAKNKAYRLYCASLKGV